MFTKNLFHTLFRNVLMVCVLLFAFHPISILRAQANTIVISEFMASNDSTLADEDGDFSDWIEIHNQSSSTIDLAGWSLRDGNGSLTKTERSWVRHCTQISSSRLAGNISAYLRPMAQSKTPIRLIFRHKQRTSHTVLTSTVILVSLIPPHREVPMDWLDQRDLEHNNAKCRNPLHARRTSTNGKFNPLYGTHLSYTKQ